MTAPTALPAAPALVPGHLLVLLDSGPLGHVTHPRGGAGTQACKAWLARLLAAGRRVLIPEICYYEARRALRLSELQNGAPSRGLNNDDRGEPGATVVIATGNVGHLAPFADARDWRTFG